MTHPPEKQPSSNPNQREATAKPDNQKLIIGLIIGIAIGVIASFYFLDYFQVASKTLIIILLALFGFFIISILLFTWFKRTILTQLFGEDIESDGDIKQSLQLFTQSLVGKALSSYPTKIQDTAKQSASKAMKLIVWIFSRSWALRILTSLFVAIGGLLGAMLLYNQNQLLTGQNLLLTAQNSLLEHQNNKVDLQNNLMEADRRSSLVFLMSNVLDKVDDEITKQTLHLKDPLHPPAYLKYRLSNPLIGRIIALSKAFKPYHILTSDSTLSKDLTSPERGQLLQALAKCNLDQNTSEKIFRGSSFQYADLRQADLKGVLLIHVNLKGADLASADLRDADLEDANLRDAYLRGTDLRAANIKYAFFNDADMEGANLSKVVAIETDFSNANLGATILDSANLKDAVLDGTFLHGAIFDNTNLEGASIKAAINVPF